MVGVTSNAAKLAKQLKRWLKQLFEPLLICRNFLLIALKYNIFILINDEI
jgi:hypothetical protein